MVFVLTIVCTAITVIASLILRASRQPLDVLGKLFYQLQGGLDGLKSVYSG